MKLLIARAVYWGSLGLLGAFGLGLIGAVIWQVAISVPSEVMFILLVIILIGIVGWLVSKAFTWAEDYLMKNEARKK